MVGHVCSFSLNHFLSFLVFVSPLSALVIDILVPLSSLLIMVICVFCTFDVFTSCFCQFSVLRVRSAELVSPPQVCGFICLTFLCQTVFFISVFIYIFCEVPSGFNIFHDFLFLWTLHLKLTFEKWFLPEVSFLPATLIQIVFRK